MVTTSSFFEAQLLVSSLSREIGIVRGTSNYTDTHPEYQVAPPQPPKTYPDIDTFSRNQFNAHSCAYAEDHLLSGDAILLKRALVDRIGVLDLRFFGYFGDLDYGIRAAARGVQTGLRQGCVALSRGWRVT